MNNKEKVMEIGDIVRNRETGELATVKYSTFGIKIGGITEDGMHWKTNGYPAEELAKYWEVVENDPPQTA